MATSPNHQASSQDQPQQQPNDQPEYAGKGAATATSHALKIVGGAVAGGGAAIFRGARKSIFNCIKRLGRGAWALIKEPVKAFLSKLLLIILAIVLIRLMLPYFISSIGYLIAKLLRWFFSPFYGIHDNISNAIQALGHGAVSVGHGIAHGTSFVGHGLGGGARALGHSITHDISPAVHEVGRAIFGF